MNLVAINKGWNLDLQRPGYIALYGLKDNFLFLFVPNIVCVLYIVHLLVSEWPFKVLALAKAYDYFALYVLREEHYFTLLENEHFNFS